MRTLTMLTSIATGILLTGTPISKWLFQFFQMKTFKNIFRQIISTENLILAWRKARKGKTKKHYVIKFEENLELNLLELQEELKKQTYSPKPLKTFILRDPKTRKISKSHFRDRIVHHAIINILEPLYEKRFICDSCANRKGKGTSYALKRFDKFKNKVSNNDTSSCFVLKADVKHYFQEINLKILVSIIYKKIKCSKTIKLIRRILKTNSSKKGMPLGNLTSQFFANVYLNELDYFIKHKLKTQYYIRYVDDFIIFNNSINKLNNWRLKISSFLKEKLEIELHPEKSRILPLSRGVDFVGFRNFYQFRLLRKRNIKSMKNKIKRYEKGEISFKQVKDSYQGWQAYATLGDSYKLRKEIKQEIIRALLIKI